MRQKIIEAISGVCKRLFDEDVIIDLDIPEEQFGDFSTNIAMQLAGQLGRSPRELAIEIESELAKESLFKTVGVAGPGFINITLSDSELIKSLDVKPAKYMKGMKVLVEYSDPNPFKPLHAGHLYTTLVGDAIARLIENAGAETIRLNYGGDVGLHVGKTMWAVIKHCGGENVEAVKAVDISEIGQWMGARYTEGHVAYEDNEQSKLEIITANKKVYSLHSANDHDSDFAQIYWYLRDLSYTFFKELYERLQVAEFNRFIPESEVTALGIETVKEQLEKGVFENSGGAVVFDGEQHGLFTNVFINSEGLPTYSAKDVGLSLTKWNDYKFDESIIITENAQKQYMEVVVKAIEQFAPELASRTKHLTHGTLRMQGGVKMSSRLGNVLMANDILDAAVEAGESSGQARNFEIVLGAIKYALIKTRIGGDVIYNPEDSAAMEGSSGPYLQYSHARACSILGKTDANVNDIEDSSSLEAGERSLVRKLSEYSGVVDGATRELAPHLICTYLYELAQEFNRFYEKNTVIGDDRQALRLSLVGKYARTLECGLGLLGIHAPEKM